MGLLCKISMISNRVMAVMPFAWRMYKVCEGGYLYRFKRTIRFTRMYDQHWQRREAWLVEAVQQKNITRWWSMDVMAQKIRKYWQTGIMGRLKRYMREFNYRESMQKLFRNAFGALSLYYQSLQNLVEGRREVLNNDKFVFEDGMTVEEKRIRFENYLIRYFGIRQSKENQEQQSIYSKD